MPAEDALLLGWHQCLAWQPQPWPSCSSWASSGWALGQAVCQQQQGPAVLRPLQGVLLVPLAGTAVPAQKQHLLGLGLQRAARLICLSSPSFWTFWSLWLRAGRWLLRGKGPQQPALPAPCLQWPGQGTQGCRLWPQPGWLLEPRQLQQQVQPAAAGFRWAAELSHALGSSWPAAGQGCRGEYAQGPSPSGGWRCERLSSRKLHCAVLTGQVLSWRVQAWLALCWQGAGLRQPSQACAWLSAAAAGPPEELGCPPRWLVLQPACQPLVNTLRRAECLWA